jgi:hypothetical protein
VRRASNHASVETVFYQITIESACDARRGSRRPNSDFAVCRVRRSGAKVWSMTQSRAELFFRFYGS